MISNLLLIAGVVITIFAQIRITSTYNKYKKIQTKRKISGFEVAKEILDKNGLSNVYVTESKGELTDCYISDRKVIRLSTDIFHGTTIASASVAAHEVGHAIQDKENYSYMRLRHSLFPVVNFCSYAGYIAILIGIFFASAKLMWIGIGLELVILFFQLVTLPVEFDASRRAEEQLLRNNLLDKSEVDDAKKVLGAAAFTYVASVLTTLFQIFRLILSASRRD